jgi:DNA polymerase-3 subunit delta
VLEAADAIRAAAAEAGIREREVFDFDGDPRHWDWQPVAGTFGSPSLFAARRLVEVRLASGKPGKQGAELIQAFCDRPPEDVVLLVVAGDWSKRDHGGKWADAIARVGKVEVFWPVRPDELANWIDRRMRARGVRADREAVQHLADRVAGNLLAAAQEVDKLALLAGDAPLDAARMDALVADSARYDVFRLLDAAFNGHPGLVARMLRGLRAEGVAVPALLGMVVMELQRGAALSRAQARGGNMAAEFRAQRVWDSKQAMYRRALARHPAPRWEQFVAEAGRVDRISKGRGRRGLDPDDAWVQLERLLLAVADPGATALLAG